MPSRQQRLHAFLESGLREHRAGHLEFARRAYEEALALAPKHPHALNLLGTVLLQLGEAATAATHLERAAQSLRDDPGVIGNLAQAYATLGRHGDSRSAFRRAARLDPGEIRYALGVATSYAMEGQYAEAESNLRELANRFPNEALVWFNLGNVARDQRRFAIAADNFRRALSLDSHNVDARNNLGSVLHALLRFEEAEHEYRACVDLAPGHLAAKLNLASLLIDLGRCREAETLCRETTALAPGLADAHTLLGAALSHQGRALEAVDCHRKVAQNAPHDPKACTAYAEALAHAGFIRGACAWFARALAIDPHSTHARHARALALLADGQLAEGWLAYGCRPSRARALAACPNLRLPRTLPSELDGMRVCILREQGLGDELFFLRYAEQLSAAGARVVVQASRKIASLIARAPEIDQVVDEAATLPGADVTVLAGDLPYALSASPASELPGNLTSSAGTSRWDYSYHLRAFWPPPPPSMALHPLDASIAMARKRLATAGNPPYLGVTWRSGTPPRQQGAESWMLYKEIAIPPLAVSLRTFPGTVLALQRQAAPGEIEQFSQALGRPVHDLTDLNGELEGMLAVLALMDEYVGVSNTNMHLRASTGRPARVLVPRPAEWRWMSRGATSPWFPGFAVYRQSLHGDWCDALAGLATDLATTWERVRAGG